MKDKSKSSDGDQVNRANTLSKGIDRKRISALKRLIYQGDVESKYELSKLTVNKDLAFRLCYEAAEEGYGPAMFSVAIKIFNNIKLDDNESIRFLDKLGESKNAYLYLGRIYSESKTVEKDMDKAVDYLKKSQKMGSVEANYFLGKIYLNKFNEEKNDNSNNKLYAVDYLLKAAKSRHSDALVELALFIESGNLDGHNIESAEKYLDMAYVLNNPRASYHSARIVESRHKDLSQGYVADYILPRYEFAAEKNIHEAEYALAKIYEEGKLVEVNLEKSYNYYLDSFAFLDKAKQAEICFKLLRFPKDIVNNSDLRDCLELAADGGGREVNEILERFYESEDLLRNMGVLEEDRKYSSQGSNQTSGYSR